MANPGRSERQLMRQRGAGMRAAKDIDFGLTFASQGSREDRQLMRQRGAGNRKIDHVDFGFNFPTPNNSRRSSSRLSKGDRRSVERSSKTPSARKERQSSTTRSVREGSIESHRLPPAPRSLSRTPQPVSQPEQPNSSKRRRLNKQAPVQISVDIEQLTSQNETSNVAEEPEREAVVQGGVASTPQHASTVAGGSARQESPLFVPENDDKENAETQTEYEKNQPSKKRRSSGIRYSTRAAQTPLVQIEPNSIVQSVEDDSLEGIPLTKQPNMTTGVDTLEAADSDANDISLLLNASESNKKAAKKRKKRKSVILVKKKRRSSDMRRESSLQAVNDTTLPDQSVDTDVADEPVEGESSASEPDDASADTSSVSLLPSLTRIPKRAPRRRNRLSVSTSPAPRDPGDEEGDETYIEEDVSPEPPTPAPTRRGKPSKNRKDNSSASAGVQRKQRTEKSSFPIQTHRMVNAEALPTIMEEDEDNGGASDAESFRMPATFSDRTQPNAVDVLAQVCRETIQSTLDRLDEMPGASASRAEQRRKRTALEAFASDLDQRLFDMSESVENRLTLEARVRKSKRELAELQARWIEVRRQRDEVALEADAIRRQNWENEEEGRRQWEISELAHNTELELGGEVSDEDNLELLLKEVASRVGGTHRSTGILDRVKSLNGQLERLATALERRQSAV